MHIFFEVFNYALKVGYKVVRKYVNKKKKNLYCEINFKIVKINNV